MSLPPDGVAPKLTNQTVDALHPIEQPQDPRISNGAPERIGRAGFGALGIVLIWNLWQLRATASQVAYLNDSAMHQQMVRFANQALLNFHLPMTQWYPYLNLGSPHFEHYQGLPATIAGGLGLIFQPNFVFRWSLYLLLGFWPLVILWSGKIWGLSKNARLAATLVSPFLISVPLVGYEQKAYIWIGFGVWAQLCASWALPFAWAWTWRAIAERRYAFRAVLLISLTVALHFETGYMAMAAIVIFPFIILSSFRQRLINAAVILGGAFVATSWVTVPLLVNRQWAAINSAIAPTGLVRGYGARQNLHWLFSGQLFDAGRPPVITIAVALGAIAAVVRWRKDPIGRALLALFVLFFLISWGPTTWGAFINLVPGHADIYFRRFQMSVSLAGILLAGYGIAWVGGLIAPRIRRRPAAPLISPDDVPSTPRFSAGRVALVLSLVVVGFAFPKMWGYDKLNARDIANQRQFETNMRPYIDPIINLVRDAHNGRVYAGLPTNWGARFTVGYVPVFEYLTARDIDQVGFTLRTASLMSQPEAEFNQFNPADYRLFGIRYLILPNGMKPPVPATKVLDSGPYHLYALQDSSYFSVVVPSGLISENKGTLALQAREILNSSYFSRHVDFAVNWGATDLSVTPPNQGFTVAPGRVLSEDVNLLHGTATGTFTLDQPANVMLSASFDPGWHVSVDGQEVTPQMLAPALVSAPVPSGVHKVTFWYQGFQWYLELAILSLLGLLGMARISRRAKRASP